MKTWKVKTLGELKEVARAVLALFEKQKKNDQAVLCLHGELGSGKTAFTKELAKLLKVKETVNSPTFVIMKIYQAKNQFRHLVHIDAYRIETIDEMRVLGFESLLKEKNTIICIEWAERIKEFLPRDAWHLNFSLDNNERHLSLTYD